MYFDYKQCGYQKALADSIAENSTINENEGWVQGLLQQDIEQALAQYQAK